MVARGALALAAAGFVAKLFSAVQRILVARWLGAEGVGLYELAAPVLTAALSLSTLGLPVGLAALAGAAHGRGRGDEALAYRKACRRILLASGITASALLGLLAPRLAAWLGDERAAPAILAVAPAVALAVVLQGERAWLQASGRMAASAVSLAIEQAARVAAAVGLAWGTLGAPSEIAAAAVAWSPAAGAAVSLAACPRDRPAVPAAPPGPPGAGARLFALGAPNWAAAAFAACMTAIDAGLIQWRLLSAGFSHDLVTALYGELNGMAVALAASPAVAFGALASALLPAASATWAGGEKGLFQRRAARAYWWTTVVSLPCAVGLWLLAEPVCRLLFADARAGDPLSVVAWSVIPLGFSQVASALCNAAGRPTALLPGLMAGGVVKTLLVVGLTGRWGLGIDGAAWALLGGWTYTAIANVRAAGRLTGAGVPWRAVLTEPLPAVLAMLAAVELGFPLLNSGGLGETPLVLALIALGAAVYLAALAVRAGRRLLP